MKELTFIIGAGLLCAGCYFILPALALIVAGGVLILVSLAIADYKRNQPADEPPAAPSEVSPPAPRSEPRAARSEIDPQVAAAVAKAVAASQARRRQRENTSKANATAAPF